MAGNHRAQDNKVKNKKRLYIVGGLLVAGVVGVGACTVTGYGSPDDFPILNTPSDQQSKDAAKKAEDAKKAEEAKKADEKKKEDPLKEGEKADVAIEGTQVDNLRENRSQFLNEYCRNESKLPPAEGKDDKSNTCSSVVIGEIAKNPVKVAFIKPPAEIGVGDKAKFNVRVEDDNGPVDLNAFTKDENGGAGDTFLEHPGELLANGTPLAHCHVGVTTLKDGFPSKNEYDAAFSGVQGVKGDLSVEFSGFNAGSYRADLWCSQPGHLILPTSKADKVQAIDSVRFEVK